MNKKELSFSDWLDAPFSVRVFIRQYLCRSGYHGSYIRLGELLDLLKAYSYQFDTNYAFGANESTWRDNVLHFEDLIIAYDGDQLIDICWWHTVRSVKRQLATPFVNETLS